MSYGHALKTVGRQDDAIAAYRKAIELEPQLGEAWWSLANLKTFRFAAADLAAMRAQLAPHATWRTRTASTSTSRSARRSRTRGEYADSFRHYAEGNRLRRESMPLRRRRDDRPACSARRRCSRREFFAAAPRRRAARRPTRSSSSACRARARPWSSRSSSSHSAGRGHDGTARPHRHGRGACAAAPGAPRPSRYPEVLAELDRGRSCARSASATCEQTRIQRKTEAPFFIDKMPNNWAHVGLIHLILPQREDHRRAPPSAELLLLGLQAALRARPALHLLPRRHRPLLPRLRRADGALRRGAAGPRPPRDLRAHGRRHRGARCAACSTTAGCRSRSACLRFYENDRAVRTASSEQVRQPIFRDARRPLAPLRRLARARSRRRWARCSTPIRTSALADATELCSRPPAPGTHYNCRGSITA